MDQACGGPGRASLGMERTMSGLLLGLGIAVLLFVATGGHLLFLPLVFILPLGGFLVHRRGGR
jgi:hypothetical protein